MDKWTYDRFRDHIEVPLVRAPPIQAPISIDFPALRRPQIHGIARLQRGVRARIDGELDQVILMPGLRPCRLRRARQAVTLMDGRRDVLLRVLVQLGAPDSYSSGQCRGDTRACPIKTKDTAQLLGHFVEE